MKKTGLISNKRISPAVIEVTYVNQQAAGSSAPEAFFTANEEVEVISASESHTTAESTAGSMALDIVKEASGAAAGTSTTSVLASTFNAKGAADTPQRIAASATPANKRLAKGDRLSYKPDGGGNELAGVIITVSLKYI
jgi:hypothetical protein